MPARLTFTPVSEATKDDFVAVFSGPGGPKYCWCMAWRATKQELKDTSRPARQQQMLSRIDAGIPVGLVGYAEGEPVAWVSIAPKDTYQRLGGPAAQDGEKIWSLACMYVRRNLRRGGLSHTLIEAAVEYARANGATTIEAYPVNPDSPSYRFMGFVPAFVKAGFEEVEMAGTRRHVMRLTVSGADAAKG